MQRVTASPTSPFKSLKKFDIECRSTASSLSRESSDRIRAVPCTHSRSEKYIEQNNSPRAKTQETRNIPNEPDSNHISRDSEENAITRAIELNAALRKLSRQVEGEVAKCVGPTTPSKKKDYRVWVTDLNNEDSNSNGSDVSTPSPLKPREKDLGKFTNPEKIPSEYSDVNNGNKKSLALKANDRRCHSKESILDRRVGWSTESSSSETSPAKVDTKGKCAYSSSEKQLRENTTPEPSSKNVSSKAMNRYRSGTKDMKRSRYRSKSPPRSSRPSRHIKPRSRRSRSRSPYRSRSPRRRRSRSPYRYRSCRSRSRSYGSSSRSPSRSQSRSPPRRRTRSPLRSVKTKPHILDELVQKADERIRQVNI